MIINGYGTKREWLEHCPEFLNKLGTRTDRDIANEYEVSIGTVFAIRIERGIEPIRKHSKHSRKHYAKLPSAEVLLKDYNELGTMQKVAGKYHSTKQAVSIKLKKYFTEQAE